MKTLPPNALPDNPGEPTRNHVRVRLDGKTPLSNARRLLRGGFWPVAIHPLNARVTSPGKQPIGRAWGADRHTSFSIIDVYDLHPKAGVGVCLGPGRGPEDSWIVDVEGDGPEAEASRIKLFGGELVDTLGWGSVRGRHGLLTVDAERMAKLLSGLKWCEGKGATGAGVYHLPEFPGLEIRVGGFKADGSVKQVQSVCPPTPGTDGKPREWNGCDTIAAVPEAFYAALERAVAPAAPPKPIPPPKPATNESYDPEARAALYLDKCDPAISGQGGHNAAFKAACKIGPGFDLAPDVAFRLLWDRYNPRCEPPWSEAELRHKVEDAYRVEGRRGWLLNAERNGTTQAKPSANGSPPATGVISFNSFISSPKKENEDDDTTPLEPPTWVKPPDPFVYHGLAGDIVRAIEPTTESDPLALLVQLLVSVGNVVGRHPYYEVEATRHYTNEFAVCVGDSSVSRKGTSAERIKALFRGVEDDWLRFRTMDGLSSGEGLLYAVRDARYVRKQVREKGKPTVETEVLEDEGVSDKRLYVLESEFGGVLRENERSGSKLSVYVRRFWDSGSSGSMTKNPTRATDAHVSIVGHITEHELRERLVGSDVSNGFANRFLWLAVRRSKVLPFGGEHFDPTPFAERLRNVVEAARGVGRVGMTRAARTLWESSYGRLTTPAPGTLGDVTNRAAPHVLRLAIVYALLDEYGVIDEEHLAASLKLWDASFRCAAHIFGDSLGHPKAERILAALRKNPDGLTRTEVNAGVFRGNEKADVIKEALQHLVRYGLASETKVTETGGGPRVVYRANEKNEKNELSLSPPYGEASIHASPPVRNNYEKNEMTPPPLGECGGCFKADCRECNP